MTGAKTERMWREALQHPDLRRLVLARVVSVTGDAMVPVALAFAVLQATGSATALGIVLTSRAVPSVVLMLFGGAVGDRFPRKITLVSAQVCAAVTQVMLGVLCLLSWSPLAAMCVLCALRGVTSSFFNPASTAAIAHVSDANNRQAAFSVFSTIGSVAEVAGPVLAGMVVSVVNPGWVLVADGVTFFASAALIARCRSLGGGGSHSKNQHERSSMIYEIREGISVVAGTPWLAGLIAASALFQLSVLPAMSVLGPVVANDHLGGASAWGLVVGALGCGGVVGGVIGMRMKPPRGLTVVYLFGVCAAGPTLLCLALNMPLPVIIGTEFVAGVAVALFGTCESTAIANNIDHQVLSRVDSINRFGSTGLKPLGMAGIAPLAAVMGTQGALIAAACVGVAAMVVPLARRQSRHLPQPSPPD